ncbi:MAG: hypothetical protein OER86_07340, partial [Phycisphaerae bacterium]|nr:hypothetical protein [Phycisphaerae bacterium]
MPRILHLLDSLSSPPPPALLALVADLVAGDKHNAHRVWAVGPAIDPDEACRLGLSLQRQVHWPSARTWPLAAGLLRRRLARENGFDQLLAWSPLAGAIGALAAPGRTAVASCLPARPGPLARRVLARGRIPFLTLTPDGKGCGLGRGRG